MDELEAILEEVSRSGRGIRGSGNYGANRQGFNPRGLRGVEGEESDNVMKALSVMEDFMSISPDEITRDDISQLQANVSSVSNFLRRNSERSVPAKERLGADKAFEASETANRADEYLGDARDSWDRDLNTYLQVRRMQQGGM